MKKSSLKYFFSIILVFCFLTLTNNYFCATANSSDNYYFQKPDSWTGNKIYVNLIDSSTNTTAFPEPGTEISKVLNKFKLNNIFELNGDLYKLSMNEEIISKGNFDKIIFSNGNDEQNITNQTTPADITNNMIYVVTQGTGTSQSITATNPFNISVVTEIQKFSANLKNKNPQLDENITNNLQKIATTLQKTLVGLYDYNLDNDLLIPLQEVDKYLSKDEGLYDELNKKIDEAKNTIKDQDITQENISKVDETIKEADNIKNNYDYFTNDQVNDIIKKLDEGIKSILPDTSSLEKLLETAKKIDIQKYTDETAKVLSDAIKTTEEALKGSLTTSKITELTNTLNDAINKLIEKNITNKITNPATGDILYIIIPVLVIATLAILFTIVYSKKKNKSQSK